MTDTQYPSEVLIGGHTYRPVASPWRNARQTEAPILDRNGAIVPFMSREHRLLIRAGELKVPRGFHITPHGRIWPNQKSSKRPRHSIEFDDPDDFGIEPPRIVRKTDRSGTSARANTTTAPQSKYNGHIQMKSSNSDDSEDPFLELLTHGAAKKVVYTDPTQIPESSILYQHRGLFKEPKKRRMTQPTIEAPSLGPAMTNTFWR